MEKFSFFNDLNNDRIYFAEDFARHLKKYFTNGIFNNELKVVANNDMTITIKEGDANIEGYRYTNTGELVKTIDIADGTLKRIDNVVIRLDLSNRNITAQVIKGQFAENPIAPDLVRNSTVYDLRIAKINIPAGTTEITQDLITDTRFITSDCGNVISTVETPDTEQLFIQIQAVFDKFIEDNTEDFNTWFGHVKDQLSKDAAGNLQLQINDINNDVGNLANLETINKNSLVESINEINNDVGNLANLETINKNSLVESINEINNDVGNLANLKTINRTNLVNAINSILIETGKNENANWRKYADGTMICWGVYNIGGISTGGQQDGSLYYTDIMVERNYGQAFIDKPNLQLIPYTNTNATLRHIWIAQRHDTAKNSFFSEYRIYSPTNASLNVSIEFVAIGRWK